jgi:hypothetical protein
MSIYELSEAMEKPGQIELLTFRSSSGSDDFVASKPV